MKTLLLTTTLLFAAVFQTYSMQLDDTKEHKILIDSTNSDSTEYELIVIELGFNAYLATQLPKEYYTKEYYKNWNYRYVTEYNIRYYSGPRRDIYPAKIDYSPFIDYGLDIEYKLYYYFRFFEKKYNVVLLQRGR